MNWEMTSVAHIFPVLPIPRLHMKLLKPQNPIRSNSFPCLRSQHCVVCHSSTSKWEPASTSYSPETEGSLLKDAASNIFEVMSSSGRQAEDISITKTEQRINSIDEPFMQLNLLRKPLWLLGPALLLITGVIPTLWLPISSIFLGPSIASLLSLTGLDCIFNLGASLFLLMADFTARSNNTSQSSPPPSYQFWNMAANMTGFILPLAILVVAQKGFLQPQLPPIAVAVILAPYWLLLLVQIITESLTWHWQSPVWLVTPVVYEAYRVLQLMRGLKLGLELGAPSWSMHVVRGLICGWVLVLGVQLMGVAWYAGFTASAYHQREAEGSNGNSP